MSILGEGIPDRSMIDFSLSLRAKEIGMFIMELKEGFSWRAFPQAPVSIRSLLVRLVALCKVFWNLKLGR